MELSCNLNHNLNKDFRKRNTYEIMGIKRPQVDNDESKNHVSMLSSSSQNGDVRHKYVQGSEYRRSGSESNVRVQGLCWR